VKEKEEEIKNLEEVLNSNNNEEIPIAVLEKEHTALSERAKELEIKVDALKKKQIPMVSNSMLNIFLFKHLLILIASKTIGFTCHENEI